jgi:MFS family permease
MNETRSTPAREWAIVGGVYLALVMVAAVWLAIDRTPPEWDHANHLERVVHCAEDLARRDVRAIVERSSFYPPVVPCAAALVYRLAPSDAASAQSVILAFLGLGMAAVYLLGRRLAGGTEGVVAAVVFGCAPFVVFSALRFQLDLPLAAMVALALVVILRTEGFTRLGWSLIAGLVFGVGMLTKPPFAAYVLVPVLLVAASSRHRRRAAVYAALALLVGAALSLPWYGPRLFGLVPQIASRSFKQAAESGHPDPLTATALLFYPTWLAPQFGLLAVVLLLVGLGVAVLRRQWIALAALLAPFLLFELLQNKNLRYTLPLMPIAAVLAGIAFGLLRGRARSVGGIVLALVCALQVSATVLPMPPPFTLPGLGVPFVLDSPPRTSDWRHREIIALISKDSRGAPVTVSVVPNDNFFSVSNFRYYGTRDRQPLQFTRAWDGEPIGIEYMILKTGDIGPSWTAEKPRRIAERLRTDASLGRAFPVIGEFQLPDASTATVRARRLTEAVPVAPAAFAREVEAAVRRAVADVVAADVQGLQIGLVYDEALLRGHLGRVDIRATAARVGELKRPGSPLLRVSDVQIVFDDVLVNPFSIHTTGRLAPLDARRVTLEQVTIREDDLQAFLKEQKGFKTALVKLEPGALAVVMRLPGPDVAARVRVLPATERPFTLVADHVTVGGIPVPALLVDWVVRTWDPAPRIASRLPVPVTLGRIDITPEAIRISARP